ncbi:MAG TPA: hypothetical protein VHA11_12130, partial [Bryobacteraceae bacterium]|nr:hypothetical protein [Bryobacteraceae bacterium]
MRKPAGNSNRVKARPGTAARGNRGAPAAHAATSVVERRVKALAGGQAIGCCAADGKTSAARADPSASGKA